MVKSLKSENLKVFPLGSGTRQDAHFSLLLFKILLEGEFHGSLVFGTPCFLCGRIWVLSLVGELRSRVLHGQKKVLEVLAIAVSHEKN